MTATTIPSLSAVRARVRFGGNAVPTSEAGLLRRIARRIWRAMEISRRRQLLAQMPDFMLKDIGINRSDIDAIVEDLVDGRTDPTRRPRPRLDL